MIYIIMVQINVNINTDIDYSWSRLDDETQVYIIDIIKSILITSKLLILQLSFFIVTSQLSFFIVTSQLSFLSLLHNSLSHILFSILKYTNK